MEQSIEVEKRLRKQARKIVFCNKQAEREYGKLPDVVRDQFSVALERIAWDIEPGMTVEHLAAAGKGVMELKKNGSPAYRVLYTTKFKDKLLVLVARPKTAQGHDKKLVDIASSRLKEHR